MNTILRMASVSTLALLVGTSAFAQTGIVGNTALDDRIKDIQTDVADDLADGEDADRFATNRYAQGWSGSIALGASSTSGNTETNDVSLGGRLRYGSGPWNHSVGIAYEFSDNSGVQTKNQAYGTYEANRYFNDQFYLFGIANASYDEFGTNKIDGFLGFGPGFRVINSQTQTWRVQAGPGVRYIEDQFNNDTTEVAGIASSRFYMRLSDTAFVSNDTDVLFSDKDTVLTNDLGVTVKVTDRVATRISLLTGWNSDPAPTKVKTDNTLGVSLVYGF